MAERKVEKVEDAVTLEAEDAKINLEGKEFQVHVQVLETEAIEDVQIEILNNKGQGQNLKPVLQVLTYLDVPEEKIKCI